MSDNKPTTILCQPGIVSPHKVEKIVYSMGLVYKEWPKYTTRTTFIPIPGSER